MKISVFYTASGDVSYPDIAFRALPGAFLFLRGDTMHSREVYGSTRKGRDYGKAI